MNSTDGLGSLTRYAIAVLVVLWTIGRFVGLDRAPGGFNPDEASDMMHLICMSEHLEDANGVRMPLFAAQFEPGEKTQAGMLS
ncbi:MAG: hypothetical protein HY074_02425, partial [Deltaproteobacteria bacterium]|nr:hypothetical protein [Deltaproteobacteria bacterium]